MRVHVRPADTYACGHYRLIWPALAVKAMGGLDVDLAERRLVGSISMGDSVSNLWRADADVVVIQRPTDIRVVEAVSTLRRRGIAVVVDMDDDLHAVHRRNHAYKHAEAHKGNVQRACDEATLVTVTTPALAERYGRHGRVRIIPNFVPKSYLSVPHKDSNSVGWGGSVGTNPDGLQELGPVIEKLMVEHNVRFRVAGPPEGVRTALGLTKPIRATGHVALDRWPYALAKFGIGLAPLADTPFNAAKSRLRPLQFAAVGVPWIGSPVDDYKAFWQMGCGRLARTPEEWEKHLLELVKRPDLRQEMTDAGREVAKANTIEGNAHIWAEAWEEAVNIERSMNKRARRR